MTTFDPTKPARAKGGWPVTICTERPKGGGLIVIHDAPSGECIVRHRLDGTDTWSYGWDLENIPETKTTWAALYLNVRGIPVCSRNDSLRGMVVKSAKENGSTHLLRLDYDGKEYKATVEKVDE